MRTHRAGWLAVLAAVSFGLGGCKYEPHPKNGALRCGPARECPDGYSCLQTGVCWSNRNAGPTALLGCDNSTTFTPNAQVIRSCILRVGCNPFEPFTAISDCVTFNSQDALPGQRCNLTANTCSDFQECEGIGIAGDDLCLNHAGGRCVGGKAVNCDSTGTSYFLDCAKAKGLCRISGGTGANAVADCEVVSSCSETDSPTNHCNGNFSYHCEGGVGYGFSCGSQGYCYPKDGGCYFSGSSCSGGNSDICSGKIELYCNSGNQFRYDCGSVGLECGSNPTGGSWCLAAGCSVADYQSPSCAESCNGTELTFCYGGVPTTVDCRNYGFATCLDGQSNLTLVSYAKCAN